MKLLAVFPSAALLAACSSTVQVEVGAPDVSVPVSASSVVHDGQLRTCRTGVELEKIGELAIPFRSNSPDPTAAVGAVNFVDLSAEIQALIDQHEAEAVTNVSVTMDDSSNEWQLLPLGPRQASGLVTGDLVRQIRECTQRDGFDE